MVVEENDLSAEIKAGRLGRLYFLYGKEPFLINMYADRIIKKAVGSDPIDFNYIKYDGVPDLAELTEQVDGLPVFADRKLVEIRDLDIDALTSDDVAAYVKLFADIPETTVLLIYNTGSEYDVKKSAVKKITDAAAKYGTVCRLDMMTPPKIAALAVKKAAKSGVVLTQENALYLTERVGGSMICASSETAKLIEYAGSGGTVTAAMIDALVPKTPTAKTFDLGSAINSGDAAKAYRIADELFSQEIAPELVISGLASHYLDLYRAKLAKEKGLSPEDAVKLFGFPKGKLYPLKKAIYPEAARLGTAYLRQAIKLISECDLRIKSSPADKRTVIEETMTRLLTMPR